MEEMNTQYNAYNELIDMLNRKNLPENQISNLLADLILGDIPIEVYEKNLLNSPFEYVRKNAEIMINKFKNIEIAVMVNK